jgi:REP element-mobilizing transposase RayT
MPDHVHMILAPLLDEKAHEIHSLNETMRTIKSASAHLINRRLNRQGDVWQEESFDHVLRSSENLDAKVDYVLRNPVRKGLVTQWQDYRWTWQRQERPTAEMKLVGPLVV